MIRFNKILDAIMAFLIVGCGLLIILLGILSLKLWSLILGIILGLTIIILGFKKYLSDKNFYTLLEKKKELEAKIKIKEDELKNLRDKHLASEIPPYLEVKSFGEYLNNLKFWQEQFAKNKWENAKIQSKPIYEFALMSNMKATYIPEFSNDYDPDAILVGINEILIGYVPKPYNTTLREIFLSEKPPTITVTGGNKKYIDEDGNIILEKDNPKAYINLYE